MNGPASEDMAPCALAPNTVELIPPIPNAGGSLEAVAVPGAAREWRDFGKCNTVVTPIFWA